VFYKVYAGCIGYINNLARFSTACGSFLHGPGCMSMESVRKLWCIIHSAQTYLILRVTGYRWRN